MSDSEDGDNGGLVGTGNRLSGWQKRLVYLVDEELKKPFSWESANCGDLWGASVMACRGHDHPILNHLQEGHMKEEVVAYVQAHGGLSGIAGEYFNTVPFLQATDGDIGILEVAEGKEVGCVVIDGIAKAKMEDGRTFAVAVRKLKALYRV